MTHHPFYRFPLMPLDPDGVAKAPTFDVAPRKKAIVVAHERSGTHFLMNTLALNFGYISLPWVNYDFQTGMNFHSPVNALSFFEATHDRPLLNIVKSHHQAPFLSEIIDYLADQFHIFYIYRDPRDVMVSFWRYLQTTDWDDGPKTATPGEFMRVAPRGGLLRYQKEQVPTLLHRWKVHVEGWADISAASGDQKIIMLRFEDLNLRFDETVKRVGQRIGRPITAPARPDKVSAVILPGEGLVGGHRERFTADDLAFVRDAVGETMDRLRIPWDVEHEHRSEPDTASGDLEAGQAAGDG